MGRGGIEPPTHGFSVPEKPRFSPRKYRFDDIEIPGIASKNKSDLCRDTGLLKSVNVRLFPNGVKDSEPLKALAAGRLLDTLLRNPVGRDLNDVSDVKRIAQQVVFVRTTY
jgi:hypothetical protein